ncbi:MAG: ABC transporter substrate-binding protein [Chloroflexia bacterium]|nr:ABC transporter substrate-binding protein [Chloroflexia bacterium]
MREKDETMERRFVLAAVTGHMSRREVLKRGAALGLSAPLLSALLAACGGDSATDPLPPAPTAAGGGDTTADPTGTAGETASGDPTASTSEPTTGTDAPVPGSDLIGELEGPEILTDPAMMPTSFSEAPQLAEMVAAGTLPPVEERIGSDPMVIKPVHEIGQYGGIWRRAFTGPGDGENGNRLNSSDKILFWDYTGVNPIPSLAKDWEVNEDGTETTIFLREGMHWSDGEPFTANDFMWWYDHIYQNELLVPNPTPEMSIGGEQGTMEMVDDFTVKWVFPASYPMFEQILAGSTQIGGGLSTRGDVLMGSYAPGHYLQDFHPDFVDQDELDQIAADEGFDDWVLLFKFKNTWRLNVDLPVVSPWMTTNPINNPTWVLERNPYYWAVDTEGNQLPYIDQIVMTNAENLEVIGLRAIAGEIDKQGRHMDLAKLPVFLENQVNGDYTVHLDTALYGTDAAIHFNQSYDGDAEIRKWFTTKEFRQALALGIDRNQLNETFWVGIGTPGSTVVNDDSPHNPGPEYRDMWATLDVDTANQMLDDLGLTEKDGDGFRLRTDNGERMRLDMIAVAGSFVDFPQIGEMVAQQWAEIGIQLNVNVLERSLMLQRVTANEHQMMIWMNDGSENILLYPDHSLPVGVPSAFMGPAYSIWYRSSGENGMEPTDPRMREAQELYRVSFGQSEEDRNQTAKDLWALLVEEVYSIGTVGLSPAVMGVRIVKNNMGNIPSRQANGQHVRTPASSQPPTFYVKS